MANDKSAGARRKPGPDGYWPAWGLFLALFLAVLFLPFIVPFIAHVLFGFNG